METIDKSRLSEMDISWQQSRPDAHYPTSSAFSACGSMVKHVTTLSCKSLLNASASRLLGTFNLHRYISLFLLRSLSQLCYIKHVATRQGSRPPWLASDTTSTVTIPVIVHHVDMELPVLTTLKHLHRPRHHGLSCIDSRLMRGRCKPLGCRLVRPRFHS